MKYKAIISDVDGTLIQQARTGAMKSLPSKKVTHAINQIKNSIHFGVATSRPLHAMDYIFDHLSLSGPCIINGGSIILDPKSHNVLWEKTLKMEAFEKVISIAKKYKINFELHDKKLGKVKSFNQLKNLTDIYNIFLSEMTPEVVEEIYLEVTKIPTLGSHKVASYSPDLFAIDITHAEATKQHGVLEVAKMLNITPSEIIGIGDGYNDFPLLMACGLKIAMGNAVEDLKAIADYVAPSIDDDGLAHVIEKFVLS